MKRSIYVLAGLGIFNFFTLTSAQAAAWQAVSFGLSPDPLNEPYKYSAALFFDGQYVPNDPNKGPTSFILSDSSNISATPTVLGERRETITFKSGGATIRTPPMVDTVTKTIDVSSIFWEAQQAAYTTDYVVCGRSTCPVQKLVWQGAIGGQFGPIAPVAYINNPDGTFTTTWVATRGNDGIGFSSFSEKQVYFTFSAPVPEPTPLTMMAVGAAILFGVNRRRRN